MPHPIDERICLPEWVSHVNSSAMEKSLSRTRSENFISFALGMPDAELFPRALWRDTMYEVIEDEALAFQYSPPTQLLKTQIVKLMQLRNVKCTEDQILMTAGAQQGISLLIRLLLEPKGKVIIEELAYPGALQAMQAFSPTIFTVKTDLKTGIDVEAIEQVLKTEKNIRFIYVVSEGGNPHSVSMSQEKRVSLATLADKYGVPIIEDDPYGFVTYEYSSPPIKSYSEDWVFYVGSFSKIFAPAFRVGWLIVPKFLIPKLSSLKECTDINTMTFTQHVICKLLTKDNLFQSQLLKIRETYKSKRDRMINALNSILPDNAHFFKPTGGIFLWVNFANHVNTEFMLEQALKAQVAFIPSSAFSATNSVRIQNGMRLNFSFPSEQDISQGIYRLKQIWDQPLFLD